MRLIGGKFSGSGIKSCRLPQYYAHSDPKGRPPGHPEARWQPLAEHLREVARLAEDFARSAGANERLVQRARAIGLLHDIGKYQAKFQSLLRGEVPKAPHSIYGAAIARFRGRAPDAAAAVAGHHAGMPDPSPLAEATTKVRSEIESLWSTAVKDCPEIEECDSQGLLGTIPGDSLQIDCSTRMLFSCLVDADRLDTARHAGSEVLGAEPLNPSARLKGILEMAAQRAAGVADGPVKSVRGVVLHACLEAANRPGPLFSLTVPTGGAKTLAAMAFGLRRAELYPEAIRRIIVVIPYLSILEQNAAVYREAMTGHSVLEHHSGVWADFEQDDGSYRNPATRLAEENWNAPVIVTTSVRFFESLFSNRPKDLRRMHNVARSVVIFDEVQTLPRGRVGPILSMMSGLAREWGTTFVFSTATQPAFEKRPDRIKDERWEPGTLDEIIPDPPRLFAQLRRVCVEWPKPGTRKTWAEVAEEVGLEPQALIIVNTRAHALKLFRIVASQGEHVLHLSNNMCPAHRLQRLAEIRRRLLRKESCLVVSTQLVEAGVDLDFPVVWRAMGPLDSIAQAAGRCNREGGLTMGAGRPAGRVCVFTPEDDSMPPGNYREATQITSALSGAGPVSTDSTDSIRACFDRYYDPEALDSDNVEKSRRGLEYATVSANFTMIDDESRSVIVGFDDEAKTLLGRLSFGALSVLRKLQAYSVNLREGDFRKAVALGAVYQVTPKADIWASREGFYDNLTGLRVEPSSADLIV